MYCGLYRNKRCNACNLMEGPMTKEIAYSKNVDVYDTSYKELFEFECMVQALIELCHIDQGLTFDFTSLQQENTELITKEGGRLHVDALWRVQCNEGDVLLFIVTEFQSTVELIMALRMYDDVNEVLRWWLKHHSRDQDGKRRPVPLVLPVVIYSGEGRWTAKQSVRAMQVPSDGRLRKLQPQQRYELIDMHRHQVTEDQIHNILKCMVFLVQSGDAQEYFRRRRVIKQVAAKWPKSFRDVFIKWAVATVHARYNTKMAELGEQLNISIDEEFEMERSIMQQLMDEAADQARQEEREGLTRTAVSSMLKSNMPDSDICTHLNLTSKEFKQIKKSLVA